MAKSKAPDLLDEIDAIERPYHYRAWLGLLSPEDRETILEVRRRWQAGHYTEKGIQKKQIFDFLKAKIPAMSISISPFRTWLDDKQS